MSKHQICVYLTTESIDYIDALVKDGAFKSRSDFIEQRITAFKEVWH